MHIDGKKILLVEDDPFIQKIHLMFLEELLEKDDIDVAEDGEKALILAVHKYDVIFMDINLPKMNGIDVVKEIRTNSSYKSNKSKIIGLTAFCDEKIHNLCFEVGFDAVEVKPINTDKLRKYI